MITTRLVSHDNTKFAEVDETYSLLVSNTAIPPKETSVTLRPFNQKFANDAGATDMRVNGTTGADGYIEFYIQAPEDADRFIHTLKFVIGDTGATPSKFGAISALSIGCTLLYEDNKLGNVILGEGLTTNFEFLSLCCFNPAIGTGTEVGLLPNVVGNSEAYVPIYDVKDICGMQYGIRLPKGTKRRIGLRIYDNVTAIDRFDVTAVGFDRVDNI